MNRKQDPALGTAPAGKLFWRLALPAIAAQLVNVLYNIVDRIYIGHIPEVGATALTGVGVTLPAIMIISAFAALVSAGGAPRVSMLLGRGEPDGAERILGACASLLVVISLALTLVMQLFAQPILRLFGASAATLPYALEYMSIYSLGTVFVQLSLGLNAFITAQGFSTTSMLTVTIGAALNIVLDPLFMFVFGMGVRGAALATILSQAVSCAWVLRFLCSEKSTLRLRARNLRIDMKLLLPCLALGLSPFIMQITENLVAVSFNVTLLRFAGDVAVGAVTILTTTMSLSMQLLHGLTQGAQPIMSFNYGAGNGERVRKTFRILFGSCLTGSMLVWAVCMLCPQLIAGMFTPDAELGAYTAWAMRIYMAASGIFGIQIACQQSFVSLGQAKVAIFLALLRKVILLIPLIFLLPRLGIFENAAFAVFLAEPVADTLAVCTTAALFFTRFGKLTAGAENA